MDADHARTYYRAAEALATEGDAAGAIEHLMQAIDTGVIQSGAILRTTLQAERRGLRDAALDAVAAALMAQPSDIDLLEGFGQRLMRAGRPDEAARIFTNATTAYAAGLGEMVLTPEQERLAELLGQVGAALVAGRHREEAIDVLREAQSFDPANQKVAQHLSSALLALGRFQEAETVCRDAMANGASSAEVLLNLANACTRLGKQKEAEIAYDHAALLSPGDRTLEHLSDAARGANTAAAPLDFVRNLYNQRAGNYDSFALFGLRYRGAGVVGRLVDQLYPNRIGRTLDLGCGSGLIGAMVFEKSDALVGVDISAAMLVQAREKGIYTDLAETDIQEFLSTHDGHYNLIVAADSLIYTGDLAEIVRLARERMVAGGRLILALEANAAGADWSLSPSGRYAHSRTYLERCMDAADLVVEEILEEELRRDGDRSIPGLFVVARRPD